MFFMEIFLVSPTDLWKAWVIASYLQITLDGHNHNQHEIIIIVSFPLW